MKDLKDRHAVIESDDVESLVSEEAQTPLNFSASAQSDHEVRLQGARTPRSHQQENVHEKQSPLKFSTALLL